MMSTPQLDGEDIGNKICDRCGGKAVFWPKAIVPGDPRAPRGSNRAVAHYQPAWTCTSCGFIEPQERRSKPPGERYGPIWRM